MRRCPAPSCQVVGHLIPASACPVKWLFLSSSITIADLACPDIHTAVVSASTHPGTRRLAGGGSALVRSNSLRQFGAAEMEGS